MTAIPNTASSSISGLMTLLAILVDNGTIKEGDMLRIVENMKQAGELGIREVDETKP